jgi:cell division protein FtsA
MQSGTVDIAAVVDNCAVALQEAEEMAGFRPTQVVIGIAGELVKGFTTTLTQERKKPELTISDAELVKLIDSVQRQALHEAERSITWETGLPYVDVRLVHSAIVGASIDGYGLTNPVGFQGRHVKIGLFNAFAPIRSCLFHPTRAILALTTDSDLIVYSIPESRELLRIPWGRS